MTLSLTHVTVTAFKALGTHHAQGKSIALEIAKSRTRNLREHLTAPLSTTSPSAQRALTEKIAAQQPTMPQPPPFSSGVLTFDTPIGNIHNLVITAIGTNTLTTTAPLSRQIAYGLKHQAPLSQDGAVYDLAWPSARIAVTDHTLHITQLSLSPFLVMLPSVRGFLENQFATMDDIQQFTSAAWKEATAMLEGAAAQQAAAQERQDKALTELLGHISHDINNWLAVGSGRMELVGMRTNKLQKLVDLAPPDKAQEAKEYATQMKTKIESDVKEANTAMLKIPSLFTCLINAARDGLFPLDGRPTKPAVKGQVAQMEADLKASDVHTAQPFWLKPAKRRTIQPEFLFVLDDKPEILQEVTQHVTPREEMPPTGYPPFTKDHVFLYERSDALLKKLGEPFIQQAVANGKVVILLDHDLHPSDRDETGDQHTGITVAKAIRKRFPAGPLPLLLHSAQGQDIEEAAKPVFDGRLRKGAATLLQILPSFVERWNKSPNQ